MVEFNIFSCIYIIVHTSTMNMTYAKDMPTICPPWLGCTSASYIMLSSHPGQLYIIIIHQPEGSLEWFQGFRWFQPSFQASQPLRQGQRGWMPIARVLGPEIILISRDGVILVFPVISNHYSKPKSTVLLDGWVAPSLNGKETVWNHEWQTN